METTEISAVLTAQVAANLQFGHAGESVETMYDGGYKSDGTDGLQFGHAGESVETRWRGWTGLRK